ncbi:MAG TPA: ATP-binding protein [Steroidobacteraceae bacterium]|nr:ATP-binding protein [Steroidobacteraceae bacterium]
MSVEDEYLDEYRKTLHRHLRGTDDAALGSAAEMGRRAMAAGYGLIDVVSLHNRAAAGMVQGSALDQAAQSFLLASLAPFEAAYRSLDEANAALRRFNEMLEAEVGRIAHGLHQAGSILATATLELDMAAKKLLPSGPQRLAGVRRFLDETGEHLRQLSHELRPSILDDLGLRHALDFLAQGFERRNGLKVTVTGQLRDRLPVPAEIAIYRIAHEALNNAVRHGGESPSVRITLEQQGQECRCVISDDGPGFDSRTVLARGGRRGLGLLGMRERASAVGGTCAIRSKAGQGTTIEMAVPLPAAAMATG